MRPEQVTEMMDDPLSQELLHSTIPVRLAYNQTDRLLHGLSRAIPMGFLWKDGRIVLCTYSNAYTVRVLAANPRVALTIDTEAPYRALLVSGTASLEIVDGVPRVPGGGPEEPL
jgi:nitroimidazol reductase NimA-like FMN-containing flavoprotein (pyridoxamine 5'-phosphate oxidase superfamily)